MSLGIAFNEHLLYQLSRERKTLLGLWIVREYGPISLREIITFMISGQKDPDQVHITSRTIGEMVHLYRDFRHLEELGLLTTDKRYDEIDGADELSKLIGFNLNLTYQVTPRLSDITSTFGISLRKLIARADNTIEAAPVFNTQSPKTTAADVFVLMPFAETLKPVYTDHILPVVERLGLSCKRGDDFFTSASIMDEVWTSIYHARLCIADCTGRNPNVFYELGIVHTIGKPCVLLAQSMDDIPFDVRHRRFIQYDYTPQGMKQFEDKLAKAVQSELQL
ncbi:MAG: hypothetical protein HZC41_23540 [Chloroflexi bacterium]|nr:hypothetical protein [Chloroflexota bacterium]